MSNNTTIDKVERVTQNKVIKFFEDPHYLNYKYIGNLIDKEAEIAKAEAELKHCEGFLAGVEKKLANERFVKNAPESVVALERKKQSDAKTKIAALNETLAALR